MRRPASWLTASAAILLASTLGAAGPAQAAPASRPPTAEVWVTTVDRAELLHQRAPVTFSRHTSPLTTITIDPQRTYQSVDGFGAAVTDSSAAVLYRLTPAAREQTLRSLFDPAAGIGISMLRQPVGSSDFTAAASHYTYDDVPAGQSDFTLSRFSIDHDRAQVLPLLRRARQLNPRLSVVATPWSPPAWMKTSGSLVGGELIDDPAITLAYARYLVKFVQAYAAAGVPIDYLTVQNEPQNRAPSGYPGTDLPVAREAAVIEALGPLLRAASPHTKILGYDHNWTTHPGDIASTPPGRSPETDYPYQLLASPAGKWLAGTAYHCYSGDPSAQNELHAAYPDKGIWFTECSGSHGATDTPAQYFRGTLTWHARTLSVGTVRDWAKSLLTWNIALDEQGGPHNGGCDTCTGLVTVLNDGTVHTEAEYYTIGHLAKFVKPGAVRIASTSFGTTGWNGQLTDVALRNPDGSTALVVHNENDDPRSFTVAVGDESFDYTLPGGALATFTWPASRALGNTPRALDLTGAVATGVPAAEPASQAIDDDASTRWSTGAGQQPGQYLLVDLGSRREFRQVAVDSGDNLGDYARGLTVAVSDDGSRWRTVADVAGVGQLSTVDLGRVRARYLKVTATATTGNWWSVADLRLYR